MRVLLVPGRFAGLLTAPQAALAMLGGWSRGAPHDEVTALPLGDGASGTVDTLLGALGGAPEAVTTTDPLGRTVPATILVRDEGGVRTAYLDAGEAIGPHLVGATQYDAGRTTSRGVGELLLQALGLGASRIVVAMGTGVAFDGGAGVLAALGVGAGAAEPMDRGGLALADVGGLDADELAAARARFTGVELVLLTDEDLPLLGFHGVHAVRAPEAGTAPDLGQQLEEAVGRFVDLARAAGTRTDLLTGRPRQLDREPGAGAGGGAGHALLLLGARRAPGARTVAELVGLEDRVRSHALVVTGTGRFDREALRAGVLPEVVRVATEAAVPAVAITGESQVGRREAMSLGLSGSYALADTPEERAALHADPVRTLTERTERLARTWSPGR